MRRKTEFNDLHLREQAVAEVIACRNILRLQDMIKRLDTQDVAFQIAQKEIQTVRDFINTPEHILGSTGTKHGEVAEHMEVGVRRAYDAVFQRPMSAEIFEHRFAPVDYRINGTDVQSKFCNGVRNTLGDKGVLGHLDKYPWFGNDGQYYDVPKDQFAQMKEIAQGKIPDGLSEATAEKVQSLLREVADRTGKAWDQIIHGASNTYAEVQLRVAPLTLDKRHAEISHANDGAKEGIKVAHEQNLSDAAQGVAIAAAFAVALGLAYGIYSKTKGGKSIFDLTTKDWKELGVKSAGAGQGGALSAVAIYGMTNYADMAAPLAGAIASTARGIYTQVDLYRAGKLSKGALKDNSMAIGGEAGVVALCAVLGQGAIPIPVLGAIVGSIAGKFVSKILISSLKDSGKELAKSIDLQTIQALKKLDAVQRKIVAQFTAEFDALDDLIAKAFDPRLNMRLVEFSVEVARKSGVSPDKILDSRNKTDRYFLN